MLIIGKKFALLVSLIGMHIFEGLTAEFNDNDQTPKITYGSPVGKPKPYQVQLFIQSGDMGTQCSGSILNKRWILTAAHCVDSSPVTKLRVLAGASQLQNYRTGQEYAGIEVRKHPYWRSRELSNDIALIKLNKDIAFTKDIYPISVGGNVPPDSVVYFSGWGKTERGRTSPQLLQTHLKTISNQNCRQSWHQINGNHICAVPYYKNSNMCQGDSGGPLVGNNKVIGIASFIGGDGCPSRMPSVFTKVEPYVPWIKSVINKPGGHVGSTIPNGGYNSYDEKPHYSKPSNNLYTSSQKNPYFIIPGRYQQTRPYYIIPSGRYIVLHK